VAEGTATARATIPQNENPLQRRRINVRGVVQGVGFRPFVYSLATDLGLTGFVGNNSRWCFYRD
jgi:hydrogenase maturation protein HypF